MSGPRAYLFDRSNLFWTTSDFRLRHAEGMQWPGQCWPSAEDSKIAEAVDVARAQCHAHLSHLLDRLCTSLGLDPYETWRWPHNDEIDRTRYRQGLELRAEAMVAMSIIHPDDIPRVITVPF